MKTKLLSIATVFLLFASGCSKDEGLSNNQILEKESNFALKAAKPGSIIINTLSDKQVIRGFGGATVWNGALTNADCDKLFTTLGLSICRIHIDPDGNWSDDISNAQKAYARGATIFSSTWSPPASMKSNNSIIGGYLLPSNYNAYVNWINSFISTLSTNGVPLYAVSVQNEPNINVGYESCTYTSTQMHDFMVGYAGNINTRVMMPETFNYNPSFGDVTLNDPVGSANTDICAFHWYGANRFQLWTKAYNLGKDIWMTEYYNNTQTLAAAITTAKDITSFLNINQCNAYVWWYVKTPDCNLITDNGINPRGYVIGQFARFIRPGYTRVDVTGDSNVTAFKNGASIVIVIVNSGSTSTKTFTVQGTSVTSVTPYVTDPTHNLAALSPIIVTNGSFTASISASSVTTFVSN